jgi:hypothetical protein
LGRIFSNSKKLIKNALEKTHFYRKEESRVAAAAGDSRFSLADFVMHNLVTNLGFSWVF